LGKEAQIEFRRYFYPALHELSFTPNSSNPIAKNIAERVLCLPMFHDMKSEYQQKVIACLQTIDPSL
jgi:dTDP-4-amino-4,6-dideoxygalactose transaminase